MEKFNLTVRVHELKLGQVFWFSGGWRIVKKIDDEYLYYCGWDMQNQKQHSSLSTLMKGSQMMVETKEIENG
jgi:hypothetical protein